jgi:uncharacterized protein YndB with AHSA1/START domain
MTVACHGDIGKIHSTTEIAARPEAVFHALTDPIDLAQWWGSDNTYHTYDWAIDLRVGGTWSCRATEHDGSPATMHGEFRAVQSPTRLELTWCASWDDFQPTEICYELVATDCGTRVRVTHSGFDGRLASCERHADGWRRVMGWLTRHTAAVHAVG